MATHPSEGRYDLRVELSSIAYEIRRLGIHGGLLMRFRTARDVRGVKYQKISVTLISLGTIVFSGVYYLHVTSILSSTNRQQHSLSDQMHFSIAVLIALFIYLLVVSIFVWWLQKRDLAKLRVQMDGLTEDSSGLSPEMFLKSRLDLKKAGDFTGIYILHNISKDQYYVGQGVRVIDRVSQHFMGHGNADVYADWKYGDQFAIKTIALAESGYQSLNDLERDAIAAYDAYGHGYNRTRGNCS